MKRIFTSLFAVLALAATAGATSSESTFDFKNNPEGWPSATAMERFDDETAGNVPQAGYTVGDVTMTASTGTYIQTDRYLLVDFDGTVTFTAGQGRKVTKVVFESTRMNFTADLGTLDGLTWEGSAVAVTFTSPNARTQVVTAVVTTDESDGSEQTVDYVECENIAAFKALAVGTPARLTLSNAQVNAVDDIMGVAYVEDATGAVEFSDLDVQLNRNDLLNGYIYVKRGQVLIYDETVEGEDPDGERVQAVSDAQTSGETFTVTPDATLTPTVLTPADLLSDAHFSELVKLENVTLTKPGRFYFITVGDKNIQVKDQFFYLPYDFEIPVDEELSSITGVFTWSGARYAVYLTDVQVEQVTAVEDVKTTRATDDRVFTLTGVCLGRVDVNQLPAGIYVRGGQKLLVR